MKFDERSPYQKGRGQREDYAFWPLFLRRKKSKKSLPFKIKVDFQENRRFKEY